jgi:hypothetical protein
MADKVIGLKAEDRRMSEEKDNNPLHAAINAKLAEIAGASPAPPSWHEAWSHLSPQSTDTERLAIYRSVRDAGSVPEHAGFFLVAWLLDVMTDARAEERLRESEQGLEALRQKFGLEEDTPVDSDDVPLEYREAMQRALEAWDTLYVQTFSEFCEHEMARLFQTDSERFDRLYEAGRQFFHGTEHEDDDIDDNDWLQELCEALVGCVEADSPLGPMGLRSWEDEDFWEVWIYPTPVELVGGRHDGEVVVPGFSLDLQQLREVFDSVAAFGWNALGLNWPQGPHVYVEGVFQGREVYLQVLACAPEDAVPGLKVDAARRRG